MSMMVAVLLAALAAVVVAAAVFRHFVPLLRNPGVPRGSFGWPIIGETLGFLRPHAANTTSAFLQDHITRYGAVFKSHLFGAPTVVSCDAELNHFVLQNEERLFQSSYPGSVRGILGETSMLVVTGEHYRRLRSIFVSMVSSIRVRPSYLADVDQAACRTIASWHGRRAITFVDDAKKLAFSVIIEQVLGLSADDPATGLILQDYNTFMKGLVSFFPLNIPGTPYARAIKARSNISLTFKGIIDTRKGGSCNKPAFIDLLLSNNELSDDDIITIVLGSLLAGYETTSVLLSLAVYFIGQSPKCLDQLKEEHESIRAGKGTGEFLTAEDYSKMEYTQLVLNETLRCGNVIKFVHRKALKDVRYKGYLIPAGWKILPIFSPVHLDPAFHVNPLQFEPCRWKVPDQKKSKTFSPFGGGLRLCPGSEIAKMEAAFFLHHLVLNYSWKLDGEDAPMAHAYVEFMRGLPIQIEPICDHEMK